MKQTKRKIKVSYSPETDLYELKINKIVLESNSPSQFYIRKNELNRIGMMLLPQNVKFILQDDTINRGTLLVRIKVIVQRVDVDEYLIRFEESSDVSSWKNLINMKDYFDARLTQLQDRQVQKFDLVVQMSYSDEKYFLIQYDLHLKKIQNSQIIKLVRQVNKVVQTSSENFNK